MNDHVAVLRRMLTNAPLLLAEERAAIDHAIAAIKERDKLRAELSVRGDYVNEALADKYAALVARLGELEKMWRNKQPLLGACRATADYQQVADDLARVVKENSDG